MRTETLLPLDKSDLTPFQFEKCVGYLRSLFKLLPDKRRGTNTTYSIEDAALAAFSVFFTQCPSFLAHQKQMQEKKGHNNAQSLFQVENIPSDNQIRNLLDPVSPACVAPLFEHICDTLNEQGYLENYRHINQTLLIPLDATHYFCSKTIHCEQCSVTEHKPNEPTYHHSAITPVIASPGNPHVLSLAPEFITPQDGHTKQDCENAAAKRWLEQYGNKCNQLGVTFLGDDLYSCQPLCELILDKNCHFIFNCKEKSHKTLYEWVNELAHLGKVTTRVITRKRGKKTWTDTYRFINAVPLRDGDDALYLNWCELVTTNDSGKVIYKNTFVTNHEITKTSVVDIVVAGRTRWKVENENNNVLKNNGYNLTHNFGHGKHYLSQLLLSLNLIAFLFHTILNITDLRYKILRDKSPRRVDFFNDLRALTRYIYFESWDQLMAFMMKGLKLEFHNSS